MDPRWMLAFAAAAPSIPTAYASIVPPALEQSAPALQSLSLMPAALVGAVSVSPAVAPSKNTTGDVQAVKDAMKAGLTRFDGKKISTSKVVFSASITKLDERNAKGAGAKSTHRARCTVSVLARDAKTGLILAIAEGQGSAESEVAMPELRRAAVEGAVSAAMDKMPIALASR